MRLQHKQLGLTFIEIITALVLIGVLAVALTPALQTYFAQYRLKGAAEGLYSDILSARTSAIQLNSNVSITFTIPTAATWCYGISSGAIACDCTSAPSVSNCNLGVKTYNTFSNTALASSGLTSNAITFSSARGVLTNTAGTATFSAVGSTESIQINVTKFGTATICSNTVGGYSACS